MGAARDSQSWEVEVFYDGECPLCMREIRMLDRLDRAGRIRFSDISVEGFDASAIGLSPSELMEKIHGRLRSGELIEGVEVFRRLYHAVGFRRLVRISRLPGIAGLLDVAYSLFAKNRLRLTGRCTDNACAIPPPRQKGDASARAAT